VRPEAVEAGVGVARALARPPTAPVGALMPEAQMRAELALGLDQLPAARLLSAHVLLLRAFLLVLRRVRPGNFSLHRAASILLAARSARAFLVQLPPRRGRGAERRHLTVRAFWACAPHALRRVASQRSAAAISVPRVRVSWDAAFRPVPVQQAPCGAVVMPPDRVPGPPEREVRPSPAGAAPRSAFRIASRRRPSASEVIGI
jgi:hypothetical protein